MSESVGVVTVNIVEATCLCRRKNKDKPNPYVNVRVSEDTSQDKRRTKPSKGQEPKWGIAFSFNLTTLHNSLFLKVWDNYKLSANQLMGCATVELASLELNVRHDLWLPLVDGEAGITGGKLHVELNVSTEITSNKTGGVTLLEVPEFPPWVKSDPNSLCPFSFNPATNLFEVPDIPLSSCHVMFTQIKQ